MSRHRQIKKFKGLQIKMKTFILNTVPRCCKTNTTGIKSKQPNPKLHDNNSRNTKDTRITQTRTAKVAILLQI